MIEIKVYGSPREIVDDDLRGHSAVVIDVLRSSATITHALTNGAREVIPVVTPAEAGELASRTGRGVSLLGGERDGKKIEGFDLSNSPAEYSFDRVNGRIIVFASTNGAPTLVRARAAERVYLGGYNNYSVVLQRLIDDDRPVVLLCSGKLEHFSMEDFVCAGMFVEGLLDGLGARAQRSDSARAAQLLYEKYSSDIPALHRECSHGQFLARIGYDEDLEICARVDTHPIIPTFIEGKIKAFRLNGTPLTEVATVPA
ncbi:2-phosphosulfolactate phosphatase [candidate division KSB1 bacterium]|nr:2-phosphosulfolactate phosphatase [candidate division KSB1 bacterium]